MQDSEPPITYVKRTRKTNKGAFVALLLGVALCVVILLQRQAILDWWALRGYEAPAEVSAIATDITLTDQARKVFYVNKPVILPSNQFNTKCDDKGKEKTIVLGCYHSNQLGIYLFKVTDKRLQGVEQVTAAHELLHAEYDRLSSKERTHINKLLQDFNDNELTDQRIKDVMQAYRDSIPEKDLVNEMHSIFGTEIADLPSELEQYYTKYFTDRQKVVSYAQAYQSEFTNRKQQVEGYDGQLKELKKQIETDQANLELRNSQLTTEREELNRLLAEGNTKEYNAKVPVFNQHVADYNTAVTALKEIVSRHNIIVDTRNAIALEQEELSKAIDSHINEL